MSLSQYVVFYIDYENNNPILDEILIPFFGSSNVVVIPFSSVINSNIKMDTKICKECGEISDGCCCKVKNFFKMELYNEDYYVYKRAVGHYYANFDLTVKKGFIIFKSTTTTTQENLTFFDTVLTENFIPTAPGGGDPDLFYMAKWLDKKECMNTIKTYPNSMRYIQTFNPLGIQALIFSNSCISKLQTTNIPVVCRPFSLFLLNLVKEGKLNAFSTFPTLFNFDCMTTQYKINWNDDKAVYDYLKNCEIQGTVFPEEPLTRRFSSDIVFFWVFIVVVIVVITVFVRNSYFN